MAVFHSSPLGLRFGHKFNGPPLKLMKHSFGEVALKSQVIFMTFTYFNEVHLMMHIALRQEDVKFLPFVYPLRIKYLLWDTIKLCLAAPSLNLFYRSTIDDIQSIFINSSYWKTFKSWFKNKKLWRWTRLRSKYNWLLFKHTLKTQIFNGDRIFV